MRLLPILPLALATFASMTASAQTPQQRIGERATVLHTAVVYVDPDAASQKVSEVSPGNEVVVIERSGPWVKVFANTNVEEKNEADEPEFSVDEAALPRSGWIQNKGVVSGATPNGDRLLYGAAATAEATASEPHAPKLAAGEAHLLYRRVTEYFPASPLAGESAWRSADIRWQEEHFDARTLPSYNDPDPHNRPAIYQDGLKKVMKTQAGTKFAALAAYDLLDAKLCGDWQGLPKCPSLESDVYEKYASQYPDSPKAAQALWNAAYRQGVLVSMYTAEENRKKAEGAVAHAHALNDQLQAKFAATDYAARAAALVFRVDQGIAIYGSDRD